MFHHLHLTLMLIFSALCSEFLSANDRFARYESLMDLAQKRSACVSARDALLLPLMHRALTEWRQKWPYPEQNRTHSLTDCGRRLFQPADFSPQFKSAFVESLPGVVTFFPAW